MLRLDSLLARLAGTAAILLVCTTCQGPEAARKVVDKAVVATDGDLKQLRERPDEPPNRIQEHQEAWTGNASYKSRRGANVPELGKTIHITGDKPLTLYDIAYLITATTGIPVVIDADVTTPTQRGGALAQQNQQQTGQTPQAAALAAQQQAQAAERAAAERAAAAAGGGAAPAPAPSSAIPSLALAVAGQLSTLNPSTGPRLPAFTYSVTGSASEVLDIATSRNAVHWEYLRERRQVRVYRYITRTFTVVAPPSTTEANLSLDSGTDSSQGSGVGASLGIGASASSQGNNNGGGTTATSKLSATLKSEFKIWDEIKAAIDQIVGPTGSAAYSKGSGTVTITTPSEGVERDVRAYIEDLNTRLTRQIVFDVRVWKVTRTRTDNYGLDLNLVLQDLAQNFQVVQTGPAGAIASGGGSLALAVMQRSQTKGRSFKYFSDSQAIVQALSSLGDVSLVTTSTKATINNAVVPFQNVTNTGYALESGVVPGTFGGQPIQALISGTVTTGFNLFLLPRILGDGQVMLQYGFSLSDLLSLQTFSSGASTIQTPNTEKQSSIQTLILRSGQTLVVAGDEQTNNSVNNAGVFDPSFFGLGGQRQATVSRSVLVVAIHPVIWSNGSPPPVEISRED